MTATLFSTTWQCPSDFVLSRTERDWLEDTSSLTAKLSRLGNLQVEVFCQKRQPLANDDAGFLGLALPADGLLREVILHVDSVPFVYARSLLPVASLVGDNASLAHLDDKPLGSELFKTPPAQRLRLEVCRLSSRQLPERLQHSPGPHLSRRSLLIKHQQPFMVAECFLPAFWQRVS